MKKQTIPTLEQAYSGTLYGSAVLQQEGVSVIEIDPKELIEIEDQPFSPYSPEKLAELAESIQNNGQMTPCNVRRKDGKYYILAGRNRKRACELAGIKVRCIVEEYDDPSADLVLTDTNLYQRRQLSPSELAFAFQMQKQAYLAKGGKKSTKAIADAQGQDVRTIQRYLKLTELNHDLLELVDQGRIPVAIGAELTKLPKENQEALSQYLSDNPEQGVKDKDLPLLLEKGQTGNFNSSCLDQVFQAASKAKREKKALRPQKDEKRELEKEVSFMDSFTDDVWSNNACLGYIQQALESLAYDEEHIWAIISAVKTEFGNMSVQQAQKHYESGPY